MTDEEYFEFMQISLTKSANWLRRSLRRREAKKLRKQAIRLCDDGTFLTLSMPKGHGFVTGGMIDGKYMAIFCHTEDAHAPGERIENPLKHPGTSVVFGLEVTTPEGADSLARAFTSIAEMMRRDEQA